MSALRSIPRLAGRGLRAAQGALYGGAASGPMPTGGLTGGGPLPAAAQAWWGRVLHAGAPLLASLQVKVPALGESITDGTISAVLKQTGEAVEEDESIVQIETDKVTVDVRAPRAGVLENVLVKVDDNVEVGHVIASIAEGASAGAAPSAAGAPAAPATPEPEQQPAVAAAAAPAAPAAPPAAAPAAAPAEQHGRRVAAIRFPPRRAQDGEVISMMPRDRAQALLQQLTAVAPGGGAAEWEGLPAAQDMIAVPLRGGGPNVPRFVARPQQPRGPPGPPRRTLTEREMELIMLGGADP